MGYQKKHIDPLSSEKHRLGRMDLLASQKRLKQPYMVVLNLNSKLVMWGTKRSVSSQNVKEISQIKCKPDD